MRVTLISALLLVAASFPKPAAQSFSGVWNLDQCADYSCSFIFLPFINLHVCSVTVVDDYPNITILSQAATLTGTFSSPNEFTAQAIDPGGCTITYTMTGTFVSPLSLAADFSVTFVGCGSVQSDCTNQTWALSGTPANSDLDADNVPNGSDNCPTVSNPGQEDSNSDGIGDACCCSGRVGDANGAGGDEPTIGDISVMIDALFITGMAGQIACLAEADVNQTGGANPGSADVSIGDISALIDYLFISGPALGLPDCI